MPLDIPYTFVAGTPAKSSEVNSNFQAVKTITDQNEVNIAQVEIDITTLQTTKADLNGAIENRFEVADPNGNYDAVNLQTFERLTANIKTYISGFVLSKYDNTTIAATPGSCWDSTGVYIFSSTAAMQVSQSNLGASATYYVYITGGSNVDNELVISSSDTTPELPVGATLFRRLGRFKTNSSGKISDVFSESNTVTQADLATLSTGGPNYSARFEIGSGYTCTADGYISWLPKRSGIGTSQLYINGILVGQASNSRTDRSTGFGYQYRVSAGDVITGNWGPIYFIPMK